VGIVYACRFDIGNAMTKQVLTKAQLIELCEHLQGTSLSIEEAMDRLFDLSEDDLTASDTAFIDERIFCCEQCNWWNEISMMGDDANDRWICEDCSYD